MKKLLTFLMMSILTIGVGWAVEGDLHDMGITQSTNLNNNAAIPSINIGEQSYPIKTVTINWRYNKATADVVTIEVKVNGTSWGTQNVGTNTTDDAVFEGESTIGAVEIIFTNHAGGGTGKGTFYVNSVKFTEGASSSGPFSLTLPTGLTGGTVTASGADDLTAITAGTEMTVTANPSTGYVLDWMKANGTVVESPYTFNINADTEITAAFKEKPTYLFYESFNKCNGGGGNDGSWSGTLTGGNITNSNLDNSDWTLSKTDANNTTEAKVYAASSCARILNNTIFTTPSIDVTSGNTYTLTFKAGAWNNSNENTTLNVYCTGGSLSASTETLVKGEWSEYSITVNANSNSLTIGFGGYGASNSRFFLDEVLLDVAVVPEVATPVISGDTPFLTSTEVTITCDTDGTTIYYTTDGTSPSDESTEYTEPFELTETTTVKAIAYDANNNASSVASKEFVKTPSAESVSEILDLNDGTTFVFNGDLVVSAQSGEYLYAQDATGGMLLYGTAPTYQKGDVIPSGFGAKKTTFKGAPELKEMTNMTTATETAQLTASAISPSQVTVANAFKYAVIQGATIENNTISVGEESVSIYNRFGVTVPTDGKTYDIYGVTGWYEGAQFMPLEFVAEPEPDYYLVGSFNMEGNNWIQQDPNYKFTMNDDGKYVLNGVTCPDNVEFKILKVKGSQTTWCGGPADGEVYGIHGEWYKDIPLTINGGKNYKIDAAGTFNFTMTIDDNNSSNNKFTVIKSPVVIKGSFDGWSTTGVEMEYNEGNTGWTKTLELAENTEFGFNDGWGNWHGGNGKEIGVDDFDENYTMSCAMSSNGNFKMLAAGKYIITINRDLTTLVVSEYVVIHSIELDGEIENGTIAIEGNKTTAAEGEKVTIIVTPDSGYELDKISVTNKDTDEPVEVNENYEFTMPDADVLVSASFKEIEAGVGDYEKVTSSDDLTNGTYLIVYENGSLAFDGGLETLDAVGNSINVTIINNMIKGGEDVDAATFTIDISAGTIKSASGYYIGQTTDANGLKSSETTAYANTVSIDADGNANIVSSAGPYLRYNATSGQTRFRYFKSDTYTSQKAIQLYKKVGEVVATLPTPVISGETPFLNSTTVTITCEDEDAEIRYTTDGTDPTAESTLYEGQFTLAEAATVKAKAFKGSEFSNIASKDFEKKLSVATIAEYIALGEGKTFVFTGNVTVTYVNGKNLYVKDNTGAALIYGNSNFDFEQGQVLAANWTATTTDYNGLLEAQNPSDLDATEQLVEVSPTVMNIAEISTDNDNEYIIVKNVKITAVDNKNFTISDAEDETKTIAGRTSFTGVEHPSNLDVTYNITCIVGEFNGTVQLYPTEYKATSAALEGVTFTEDRQWATWCGEDDLSLPENVTAYVVTGVNTAGTAVDVAPVDYIPAGLGVLLYSETTAANLTAEVYTGEIDEDLESALKGTLEDMTISEDVYVLYNNKFILAQNGTTVGAHRCYLPASVLESAGQSGAPMLRIALPGTITGIDDLRYDSNGKAVGYYDLTGRYVGTSLNGKRGIFITSDGKKVVK